MIPEGASGLTYLVDPDNLVVKVEATVTFDLRKLSPGSWHSAWHLAAIQATRTGLA